MDWSFPLSLLPENEQKNRPYFVAFANNIKSIAPDADTYEFKQVFDNMAIITVKKSGFLDSIMKIKEEGDEIKIICHVKGKSNNRGRMECEDSIKHKDLCDKEKIEKICAKFLKMNKINREILTQLDNFYNDITLSTQKHRNEESKIHVLNSLLRLVKNVKTSKEFHMFTDGMISKFSKTMDKCAKEIEDIKTKLIVLFGSDANQDECRELISKKITLKDDMDIAKCDKNSTIEIKKLLENVIKYEDYKLFLENLKNKCYKQIGIIKCQTAAFREIHGRFHTVAQLAMYSMTA
jgi:hypothetical protein